MMIAGAFGEQTLSVYGEGLPNPRTAPCGRSLSPVRDNRHPAERKRDQRLQFWRWPSAGESRDVEKRVPWVLGKPRSLIKKGHWPARRRLPLCYLFWQRKLAQSSDDIGRFDSRRVWPIRPDGVSLQFGLDRAVSEQQYSLIRSGPVMWCLGAGAL